MNFAGSSLNIKGCNDIWIRKLEFVAKIQFLSENDWLADKSRKDYFSKLGENRLVHLYFDNLENKDT